MSFSLKVSCDSYGFRNGFRWVPHAGQKVEFELSPKPCAKTGMGSVWVPISVTYENPPLDSLSAVQKQAWVPCGFRMGSEWLPSGFRTAPGRGCVVKIELAPGFLRFIWVPQWVPMGSTCQVTCEIRALAQALGQNKHGFRVGSEWVPIYVTCENRLLA